MMPHNPEPDVSRIHHEPANDHDATAKYYHLPAGRPPQRLFPQLTGLRSLITWGSEDWTK